MSGSITVGVAWLALVLAASAGVIAWLPRARLYDVCSARWARARKASDGAAEHLGRPVTAAVVMLAGWALAIITGWVLGRLAHRLEPAVDVPVFDWFAARQVHWWTEVWQVLTQLGNRPETQALTIVAALVFAFLARRGRWWVPLVMLPMAYLMEKFGGQILSRMVDRGHPPTTLGTWVSGGCARLVVVYGLVVFFGLRWRKVHGRRVKVSAWCVVAFLAAVEAYSRTYLLKHWVTDVAGGLVFGLMILVVVVLATQILDPPDPDATDGGGAP